MILEQFISKKDFLLRVNSFQFTFGKVLLVLPRRRGTERNALVVNSMKKCARKENDALQKSG